MPLVPAICTQCGSRLEIDSAKEAAICPYCNTPFVTEKAINHYNTTNVIHAGVVNVSDSSSLENRVKAGDTFIKLGDYISAINIFTSLTEEYPYDYRSWWGYVRAITKDLTDYDVNQTTLLRADTAFQKACKVASPDEIKLIDEPFKAYSCEVRTKQDRLIADIEREIQKISNDYQENTRELRAQIEVLNAERAKMSKFFLVTIVASILLVIIGIAMPRFLGANVFVSALLIILGSKNNKRKPARVDKKLLPLGEQLQIATIQRDAKIRELRSKLALIKS